MDRLHAYGLLPYLFQVRNNIPGRDLIVHLGDAVVLTLHTAHLNLAVVVARDVGDGLNPLEQGRKLVRKVVDASLQLLEACLNRVDALRERLDLLVDAAVDALKLLGELALDDAVVLLDGGGNRLLVGCRQLLTGRLDGFVDRIDFALQLLIHGGIARGDGILQQLQLGIHRRNVVVVGQQLVDPALHRVDAIGDGRVDGCRVGRRQLLAGRSDGLRVGVGNLRNLRLQLLLQSGDGRGDVGGDFLFHPSLEVGDARVDGLDGGLDGGDVTDQSVVLLERGEGGRHPILLVVQTAVQRGYLLLEPAVGRLKRLDEGVDGLDAPLELLAVLVQLRDHLAVLLTEVRNLGVELRKALLELGEPLLQLGNVALNLFVGLLQLRQRLLDGFKLLVDARNGRPLQLVDPIGQLVNPLVNLAASHQQQATQ